MLVLELESRYTIRNYSDNMTDEAFYSFCAENRDLRIERDSDRNVIVMEPVVFESGYHEGEVFAEVRNWTKKHGKGKALSPSTGFTLPNGAIRSSDACWISEERLAALDESEKQKFAAIVPDFIIEVRSKSDRLKTLQAKMQEWIENGVRLAWLIDVKNQTTYIYREIGEIEIIEGLDKILSGEDILPGFEFKLDLLQM